MHPTLSVVVPVKDDAVALRRCLRQIGRQTVEPLEVIVVDNGSRDTTAAVAREHGARVVVEAAPGIAAAASAGYDAAVGQVIVRCDADTVPPEDWLERIADHFAADERLEALTGTGVFYEVPPLPFGLAAVLTRLYLRAYYLSMHAAMARPPLWGSNMAVRAEIWARVSSVVHRHDPEVHDDVDLSFALGPHLRVRVDRRLVVGVSGRSLLGGAAGRRRMARAWHSLAVGWAVMPPWERWQARLSGAVPRGPRAWRSVELPTGTSTVVPSIRAIPARSARSAKTVAGPDGAG